MYHTLRFYCLCLAGAVAAISDLAVTTRCAGEKVGRSYKLNLKGDITSETNIPTTVGKKCYHKIENRTTRWASDVEGPNHNTSTPYWFSDIPCTRRFSYFFSLDAVAALSINFTFMHYTISILA